MNTLTLAISYLRDRALASMSTVITLALGVAAVLVLFSFAWQVQARLERDAARVDAVIGAKGSPLNLVLSTIYHADMPQANIPLSTLSKIQRNPSIKTAIPIALGDSYQGFRVVGTEVPFIGLYQAKLRLGAVWQQPLQAVIGSAVAHQTSLKLGRSFASTHGLIMGGDTHTDKPFTVTGILAPTGTVLDQLILTSLESVWLLHGQHAEHDSLEKQEDVPVPEPASSLHDDVAANLPTATGDAGADIAVQKGQGLKSVETDPLPAISEEPATTANDDREITALLLSYNNPAAYFQFPKWVNKHTDVLAASPSLEAAKLFSMLGVGLQTLRFFAYILIAVSLLGIFAALYSSLQQRQPDLAILRALGLPPHKLLSLVLIESALLAIAAIGVGFVLAGGVLEILPTVDARLGFIKGLSGLPWQHLGLLAVGVLLASMAAAMIPAWLAYRINVAAMMARR